MDHGKILVKTKGQQTPQNPAMNPRTAEYQTMKFDFDAHPLYDLGTNFLPLFNTSIYGNIGLQKIK